MPNQPLNTDHVLDLNDQPVPSPLPPNTIVAHINYFRATGKYYSSGACLLNTQHPDFAKCVQPRDFGLRLRELNKLPGLSTGTWAGFFVIATDYPELVTPA